MWRNLPQKKEEKPSMHAESVFSFHVSNILSFHYFIVGPNTWANNYAICGQSSQSPINIELDSAKHDSSLNAFTFTGYNTLPAGAAYTLENNGYGGK